MTGAWELRGNCAGGSRRGRRLDAARLDHQGWLLEHGQVRERVAGHPDQVGALAGFDRAGLGREADRGEALVQSALRGGGSADATDLLRLQAGVYRYTESIDLATKLVDRATSGVKTVIQGQ